MRTFLVEIDNRPDDVSNISINHYSTEATTKAMFYKRCANAITTTDFETVYLEALRQDGSVIEKRFIKTSYQPPEPEPEPEDDTEPAEENN